MTGFTIGLFTGALISWISMILVLNYMMDRAEKNRNGRW